jgi:hypothetical protein
MFIKHKFSIKDIYYLALSSILNLPIIVSGKNLFDIVLSVYQKQLLINCLNKEVAQSITLLTHQILFGLERKHLSFLEGNRLSPRKNAVWIYRVELLYCLIYYFFSIVTVLN